MAEETRREKKRMLTGRKRLMYDASAIDASNLADMISQIQSDYQSNVTDINYLDDYYRNKTPIRFKTKTTRPEINNQCAEARAMQIVDFKTGYICGAPIVYTNASTDVAKGDDILRLNRIMAANDRDAVNKDVFDWMHICGVGVKRILPAKEEGNLIEICSLDPRTSGVVYSSHPGNAPIACFEVCKNKTDKGTQILWKIHTPSMYFVYDNTQRAITEQEPHILGRLPIIEYQLSPRRMGVFEPVLDLLDAINVCDSDRLDGLDQFINSLVVLYNAELPEGTSAKDIREQGIIKLVKSDGTAQDIKILSEELNQTSTQTLKDDLYNAVLQIVGMPNQSDGSSSDSSNNGAMFLKQGYQLAETRAQTEEVEFKRSERKAIFLECYILNNKPEAGVDLDPFDVDTTFTRKQYSDTASKSTVFATLIGTGKVAPIDAWNISGLSTDPEACCKRGEEYEKLNKQAVKETTETKTDEQQTENADSGNDTEV